MSTAYNLDKLLGEMRDVFARMPADAVPQLAGEIAAARRVLINGVGRNGLVLQAFAMRLMHIGLDAHFVGQLSAPPVGRWPIASAVKSRSPLPTGGAES